MGNEDGDGDVRKRTKKVRVFGNQEVILFNGSKDPCRGKCKYYREIFFLVGVLVCNHTCHLAIHHDGPCCCGNPVCRKQRLNDSDWLENLLTSGATAAKLS